MLRLKPNGILSDQLLTDGTRIVQASTSYLIQLLVNLFLDIRMVQQVQEGPHQAGGRRLHAGQEEVDQVVEQRVVSYMSDLTTINILGKVNMDLSLVDYS